MPTIDVNIASVEAIAARLDEAAGHVETAVRRLAGPGGWQPDDHTATAIELSRMGRVWIGYLTQLRTAVADSAQALRRAAATLADADAQAVALVHRAAP